MAWPVLSSLNKYSAVPRPPFFVLSLCPTCVLTAVPIMFPKKAIPFAAALASGVLAQSNTAQCGSGFDWNKNSLGQDPCAIGSMMDASCRSLGEYTYPSINASEYYLPPRANHSGDLVCDCNTVMYSLYMACALCQEGQIYSWLQWISQCDSVYVAQYPSDIAQGTAVPHWAYDNITSLPNMIFNNTVAMSIGRDPEEIPKQISTVSIGGSSTTGMTIPTNTKNTSKSGRKVGAIVGGVLGSIVALTTFAIVAFLYIRHRQRQRAQQLVGQQMDDPYKRPTVLTYGPSATSVPLTTYNPADPSTFPPSLPTSVVYTTPPPNTARGTYSGAAEI